jgi:hypothetical protein
MVGYPTFASFARSGIVGRQEANSIALFGPKFCSMNYSSKVDEYNKQGIGIEKKDCSELVGRLK